MTSYIVKPLKISAIRFVYNITGWYILSLVMLYYTQYWNDTFLVFCFSINENADVFLNI